MDEYAIVDNDGKLWGNPAQMFTSEEAAYRALDFLLRHRIEMAEQYDEATRQWPDLERAYELTVGRAHEVTPSGGQPRLSPANQEDMAAVIAYRNAEQAILTWTRERDRSFTVVKRTVTPWEKVA